jgi:hypothetical protein
MTPDEPPFGRRKTGVPFYIFTGIFNQILYETVIETRDGVQLPEQIGWLFIGTCPTSKKRNINYVKSNKYGVEITNNNWETDGKLAKIFFTNYAPKHKIKNIKH